MKGKIATGLIALTVLGLLTLFVKQPIENNVGSGTVREYEISTTTETIRDKIANKVARERASIKGQEIAKALKPDIRHRDQYTIEIVETNDIEGGIEVYARVWGTNGKQIGFGKDGTVDVERFRIFNPPILVPDENGDIVQTDTNDITGDVEIRRFREDPKEAVLQVIEHNLSIMENIHNDRKIVAGKRGRTTSTFYPAAGENSPVDGWVREVANSSGDNNSNWNQVHDGPGDTNNDTGTALRVAARDDASNTIVIARGITLFDTSPLGSDTIDSATVSLTLKTDFGAAHTAPFAIGLVSSNPNSDDVLVNGDYTNVGDAIDNPTEYATRVPASDFSPGSASDWSITDLSIINGSGLTKLGFRMAADMDDVKPTFTGADKDLFDFYQADEAGTTNDPKLVVEHTEVVETNTPPAIYIN